MRPLLLVVIIQSGAPIACEDWESPVLGLGIGPLYREQDRVGGADHGVDEIRPGDFRVDASMAEIPVNPCNSMFHAGAMRHS